MPLSFFKQPQYVKDVHEGEVSALYPLIIKYLRYYGRSGWLATVLISEDTDTLSILSCKRMLNWEIKKNPAFDLIAFYSFLFFLGPVQGRIENN